VVCGDPKPNGRLASALNYRSVPMGHAPKYLIRDNDKVFGIAFKARIRAMGIRNRPTSFRSPWQNGYVERLIGSIRRECTDHLIVFSAEHLRRILAKYATYFNEGRTHVSLGTDAPYTRPIERFGDISCASNPWRVAPSVPSNLVFGSDTTESGCVRLRLRAAKLPPLAVTTVTRLEALPHISTVGVRCWPARHPS
jgi:Integrase core domain